jgi:hypothetical protein
VIAAAVDLLAFAETEVEKARTAMKCCKVQEVFDGDGDGDGDGDVNGSNDADCNSSSVFLPTTSTTAPP